MKIKVLFFGRLSEMFGKDICIFENISTTEELIKVIEKKAPVFRDYRYTVAVNHEMINGSSPLNNDDEVAFMPPFAGG